MEEPGYKSDQLYVLRHVFQPNEPLREALAKLMSTGSERTRRFSIYGSDERVMEMVDSRSHKFDIQLREADAYLAKKANTQLLLEGKIQGFLVRGQGQGALALRLLMKPEATAEYNYVRGALDVVKMGKREHTFGLEDRTLYTTLPQDQLRSLGEVKRNLAELNQALGSSATRRLYGLMPLPNLVGRPMQRRGSSPEGVESPEIHAS